MSVASSSGSGGFISPNVSISYGQRTATECAECDAWVSDATRHAEWHARMAKVIDICLQSLDAHSRDKLLELLAQVIDEFDQDA